MKFENCESIIYSDTQVSDIFIAEYMPSMESKHVKLYLYCLFLSKYNRQISVEEFSKKLDMEINDIKESFLYLESIGIINRKNSGFELNDLKQREINKIYRMKSTSTPEEAALSCERNKKRIMIITAINNAFFQGVMSPSWYTDIDAWFDKYNFEEDVMYALFQHCFDHKALSKNYIMKVADNWLSKNIRNSFDLDKYFIEYQMVKKVRMIIVKKLKLSRNLTQYEEDYIEKWVMDYGYSMEIIDLALKRTTSKTNPNFKYIDAVISDWHKNRLKTMEDVQNYNIKFEKDRQQVSSEKLKVPQHANFNQREYDKKMFENFFSNTGN